MATKFGIRSRSEVWGTEGKVFIMLMLLLVALLSLCLLGYRQFFPTLYFFFSNGVRDQGHSGRVSTLLFRGLC